MNTPARALLLLGAATCVAAVTSLESGLVALGIGGLGMALGLPAHGRRALFPVILALLAAGATGGGMIVARLV